jgi:hypothetical protein
VEEALPLASPARDLSRRAASSDAPAPQAVLVNLPAPAAAETVPTAIPEATRPQNAAVGSEASPQSFAPPAPAIIAAVEPQRGDLQEPVGPRPLPPPANAVVKPVEVVLVSAPAPALMPGAAPVAAAPAATSNFACKLGRLASLLDDIEVEPLAAEPQPTASPLVQTVEAESLPEEPAPAEEPVPQKPAGALPQESAAVAGAEDSAEEPSEPDATAGADDFLCLLQSMLPDADLGGIPAKPQSAGQSGEAPAAKVSQETSENAEVDALPLQRPACKPETSSRRFEIPAPAAEEKRTPTQVRTASAVFTPPSAESPESPALSEFSRELQQLWGSVYASSDASASAAALAEDKTEGGAASAPASVLSARVRRKVPSFSADEQMATAGAGVRQAWWYSRGVLPVFILVALVATLLGFYAGRVQKEKSERQQREMGKRAAVVAYDGAGSLTFGVLE